MAESGRMPVGGQNGPCASFGALMRAALLGALSMLAIASSLMGLSGKAARATPLGPSASAICERAALVASQRTGVPLEVLRAITLTETGRRGKGGFAPWPWTVNMEGKGIWFDSRAEALAYVKQQYARGARSFDVGCFQINYKWHGKAFGSIEEMFDPLLNAEYAGRHLSDLYREKGNWIDAAGAYHSRTPKFANRYKKRFAALLEGPAKSAAAPVLAVAEPAPAPPARQEAVRPNNFPLLLGGAMAPASLGSLMPATAGQGAARLIGGG